MIKYKRIIISDLHLGSGFEDTDKISKILSKYSADELILNGDIFDIWKLNYSKNSINKIHYDIIDNALKNFGKIIYICGNHDDLIRHFIPFNFNKITFLNEYYFTDSIGKSCFVVHGDKFDYFSNELDYVAKISDFLYQKLFCNMLSKNKAEKIINITKNFISRFNRFDDKIIRFGKDMHMDIIFCGHTHIPKIYKDKNLLYINSGDFIDSNTFITEDFFGNWNLVSV